MTLKWNFKPLWIWIIIADLMSLDKPFFGFGSEENEKEQGDLVATHSGIIYFMIPNTGEKRRIHRYENIHPLAPLEGKLYSVPDYLYLARLKNYSISRKNSLLIWIHFHLLILFTSIRYTISIPGDGRFGIEPINVKWNGMVGMVVNKVLYLYLFIWK